jgi:TPR repeat protein
VADAAYVLSLYYGEGRGVRRDEERRLAYLTEAAEGGCLPACYELGMCYLEGRTLVRNRDRAVACFADAATLWAESGDHVRRETRPEGILAESGLTLSEAAGAALYMLGYCALYAVGDRVNPAIAGNLTPAERVTLAAAYFRDAAAADHVGGLTALGDLYAYGLLKPETATAEDESLRYYMEAARVGTSRAYISEMATDSPIDALLSLANCSRQVAEAAAAEGDEGSAELAKVQTWRSLAGGAEEGSLDAYVSMAACAYRGYGTPKDPTTALWFLNKVARAEKGRVTASLWLGDLYYAGVDREPSPEQAEEAYLRAIETPDTESECGEYTLRERRESRRLADRRARAEACYRLAVLRAVHFADGESRRESFTYLVRAILMGHTAAREDLARMYAYESAYVEATSPKEKKSRRKGLPTPASAYARGRLNRRAPDSDTKRDHPAARSHSGWMTDYYTALWPEPKPFSREMRSLSIPRDVPEYIHEPVTPFMRVDALCYLGECFFEGHGLVARPDAAYACFSAAVNTRLPLERGQPMPVAMTNAIYSLGWCTLYGVGTAPDPYGAVRLLNRVAKSHSGAAYTLGVCYEEGKGVVIPDISEALKYYRKAETMGHPKAAEQVLKLEKLLKSRQED